MEEVSAANRASVKNAPPIKLPMGIASEPNAMGSDTKNRLGPPAGSAPNANTIGKIAKPAIRATIVSALATIAEERGMLVS